METCGENAESLAAAEAGVDREARDGERNGSCDPPRRSLEGHGLESFATSELLTQSSEGGVGELGCGTDPGRRCPQITQISQIFGDDRRNPGREIISEICIICGYSDRRYEVRSFRNFSRAHAKQRSREAIARFVPKPTLTQHVTDSFATFATFAASCEPFPSGAQGLRTLRPLRPSVKKDWTADGSSGPRLT